MARQKNILELDKRPFFYQTWWFYALCLLVLCFGAIDKGALTLINALFPLPNINPANNGQGYNLVTDLVTSDPRNQENLKLDYNLSQRLHLSARFNHENENVPAPYGPFNTVNFNSIPYPAAQEGRNGSNSLVANFTDSISDTLTNTLTVSYTRFALGITLGNPGAVSRSGLGYPYANVYPGSNILPNISTSYTHAGNPIPGGERRSSAAARSTAQSTALLFCCDADAIPPAVRAYANWL